MDGGQVMYEGASADIQGKCPQGGRSGSRVPVGREPYEEGLG